MTLLPPGPLLVARNRRLVAQQLDWPDDAVEACEKLDADHPGWHTDYRHPWRDKPAGYYGRHDGHWHLEPNLHGATPDELRTAIAAHTAVACRLAEQAMWT